MRDARSMPPYKQDAGNDDHDQHDGLVDVDRPDTRRIQLKELEEEPAYRVSNQV